MKTPFKSVLATLVALFLSISLSGCFEEDGVKTASQGDSASSPAPDSGKVRLVLNAESKYIEMNFSNRDAAQKRESIIRKALEDAGVPIKVSKVSGDRSFGLLYFELNLISEEVSVVFDKEELEYFIVQSRFGKDVARWDPSFGNEAKRTA